MYVDGGAILTGDLDPPDDPLLGVPLHGARMTAVGDSERGDRCLPPSLCLACRRDAGGRITDLRRHCSADVAADVDTHPKARFLVDVREPCCRAMASCRSHR